MDNNDLRYLDESDLDDSNMEEDFVYFKTIKYENTKVVRLFTVENVKSILVYKLLGFTNIILYINIDTQMLQFAINKETWINFVAIVNSSVQESNNEPYLYVSKAELLYKVENLTKAQIT